MEFLKDSSKNLQINLSHKNNTLPGLIRTDRNFYLSPEYSTGIFEQHNAKLYQNPLPPRQNLVAPNYYLQNESGFNQNFPVANYFGVERGSGTLQRYEIYQEENGANFEQAPNTEVNHQQEKERFNGEKVLLMNKSSLTGLVLFNCKL